MRTVTAARIADGKGRTVGRDRAYAEWRFFTDSLLHSWGAAWPRTVLSATAGQRISHSVSRRLRVSAAPSSLGYQRWADEFHYPDKVEKKYRDEECRLPDRLVKIFSRLRQCGQGKAGGRHQIVWSAGCVPGRFRIRAADAARRSQRAGFARPVWRPQRDRGQGTRQDMALPQRPMRAGSLSLSRRSNPCFPNPKLRGDRL